MRELQIALIFLGLGIAGNMQWQAQTDHEAAMRKALSVPCITPTHVLAEVSK